MLRVARLTWLFRRCVWPLLCRNLRVRESSPNSPRLPWCAKAWRGLEPKRWRREPVMCSGRRAFVDSGCGDKPCFYACAETGPLIKSQSRFVFAPCEEHHLIAVPIPCPLDSATEQRGRDATPAKLRLGHDILDDGVGAGGTREIRDKGNGAGGDERTTDFRNEIVKMRIGANALPQAFEFGPNGQFRILWMQVAVEFEETWKLVRSDGANYGRRQCGGHGREGVLVA